MAPELTGYGYIYEKDNTDKDNDKIKCYNTSAIKIIIHRSHYSDSTLGFYPYTAYPDIENVMARKEIDARELIKECT